MLVNTKCFICDNNIIKAEEFPIKSDVSLSDVSFKGYEYCKNCDIYFSKHKYTIFINIINNSNVLLFTHFLNENYNISYYPTNSNKRVDFKLKNPTKKNLLIQINLL